MKSLTIQSQHYRYLLGMYREYLQVSGYAASTVEGWTVHVQEFLHYTEHKNIVHISGVDTSHLNDFLRHINQRTNKTTGGGLSGSTINNMISAVNVLAKFLNANGDYFFESIAERANAETGERTILTVAEIKQLYEATFLPYEWNNVAMGQRDRAVLALYYGCGLRRGEGVQLNMGDIDLQRRLVFVRKGKGNKQRYVPIAAGHVGDLGDYMKQGREWFLYQHIENYEYHNLHNGMVLPRKKKTDDDAFLVTHHGTRFLNPEYRIKYLQAKAEIENPVTLHGLRHSIATHLLQSGMELEEIAKFLGHASLVSTQIYTHIVNEL